MSDERQPTEAEMQAAYEEQLKQIRVEDVVAQTVVSLLNLGARKAGLAGGTPEEVDPPQVKVAVDAARALLPLVEPLLGQDAATLREALSQLQMAYVQLTGGTPEAPAAGGAAAAPEPPNAGPSAGGGSRLWVPGQ